MPDQLFEQFRLDVAPPPVEQVRRRGDRIRRRSRLAAAGGVAAVVAVAVSAAAAAGGAFRDHAVAPATHSRAWVTAIPADFPLAAGSNDPTATIELASPQSLPADAQIAPEGGQVPIAEDTITECGRPWQWVLGATEIGGVAAPGDGPTRPGETRTLAVFPDEQTADAVEQSIRSVVVACRVPPAPTALPSSLGDASFAWSDHGAEITGIDIAVRIGNAVLLEQTATATSTDQGSEGWVEMQLKPVLTALCVYAAHGCSAELPTPTRAGPTVAVPATSSRTAVVHEPPSRHVSSAPTSGVSSSSPSSSASSSPSSSASATSSASSSPTGTSTATSSPSATGSSSSSPTSSTTPAVTAPPPTTVVTPAGASASGAAAQ